jgi:hypothetical protein
MTENAFIDKSIEPDDHSLRELLGVKEKYWYKIKQYLDNTYEDITGVWKYYYEKSGWFLQVRRKKRILFWLTPQEDNLLITFWFGDKAVSIIEQSDLPQEMKDTLNGAIKFQIGRRFQINIKQDEDVNHIIKLININTRN